MGGFCMARKYTHIKAMEPEIRQMKEEGKTSREIAEHFGFKDKYVVKQLISRENRNKRKAQAGIPPRRPGRPAKGDPITDKEKDYEIKRLKMENKLLRDFLHLVGRRRSHQ